LHSTNVKLYTICTTSDYSSTCSFIRSQSNYSILLVLNLSNTGTQHVPIQLLSIDDEGIMLHAVFHTLLGGKSAGWYE
jgi:hypothetical protein